MSEEPKASYDVVVAQLRRRDGALELDDDGLRTIAQRLAAVDGDARLERLLGVAVALDFVATQQRADAAAASLVAVLLTTLEQTRLSDAAQAAFADKLKRVTGGDTATRVLGGARPDGTIPAGPGARFAALDKKPR